MNWSTSFSRKALAVAAMLAFSGTSVAADEPPAQTPRGIAAEKPAEGPSVEIDDGFMVPYTETIPGTDLTFEMIPIPSGDLLLGSPESEANRHEDEGPQVRIAVPPMWVAKHEVTWAEYQKFMQLYGDLKKLQSLTINRTADAGGASADADENAEAWKLIESHAWRGDVTADWNIDAVTSPTPLYDPSTTYMAGDGLDQPAVTMTQFAARQYTKWLSGITGVNYRLPTEAEWEHAARAGTVTAYSFGDDPAELDRFAWFTDNADYATHPVGTKEPNPWGLHDMHGNAAEWTLDQYDPQHYASLGADVLPTWEAVRWPTRTVPRSIRGGSWLDSPEQCRSAARHKSEEDDWKLSDPNLPLSPWWYTEEPAMGVGMRLVRPFATMSNEDKRRAWELDAEELKTDVIARLKEGRGALGQADPKLPAAIEAAEKIGAKP